MGKDSLAYPIHAQFVVTDVMAEESFYTAFQKGEEFLLFFSLIGDLLAATYTDRDFTPSRILRYPKNYPRATNLNISR